MSSKKKTKLKLNGICVSAKSSEEYQLVEKMILSENPNISIIPFENLINDPGLMDECDLIFTVGGDGSVAWLVGTFYKLFESVEKLKPIVPVIRPKSVGYLKQLSLQPEKEFREGFRRILKGKFTIQQRTILKTSVQNTSFIAVNEIYFQCEPHLGKFKVFIVPDNHKNEELLTKTMADGAMISTAIGSTAWALSHHGHISINENSLQLIFIAGIHSSANFILPRKKVRLCLELKNPVVNKDTIWAYNKRRKEIGVEKDINASKSLEIVYGPRITIDGKIVAYGINELVIDPAYSIPFLVLKESPVTKARKLTKLTKIS